MAGSKRIAFLLQHFGGGGLQRVVLNLLTELAHYDLELDLVLANAQGFFLDQLPKSVRVVNLDVAIASRTKDSPKLLPPLIQYLRQEQPNVLLSNLVFINAIAVLARRLSGVACQLILVEHLPLLNADAPDLPQSRLLQFFRRTLYPDADAIVSVTGAMAQQMRDDLNLDPSLVQVIENPVIAPSLLDHAAEFCDHPWFQPNQPPVFLAAGRLMPQKDFFTLIRAFALVQQQRSARLMILGEGAQRRRLEALVRELGVELEVDLPGFEENPYKYMSRASAFVLSSRWEALPTVLIEAMGCGCQVIATDCPFGPREMLADGHYGQLVPVQDAEAMAAAMLRVLDCPIDRQLIQQRAASFSRDRAVARYLDLMGLSPSALRTPYSALSL